MKLSPDGVYICTFDTFIDNLKIIEDAIINCNLKEVCKIGLVFLGD